MNWNGKKLSLFVNEDQHLYCSQALLAGIAALRPQFHHVVSDTRLVRESYVMDASDLSSNWKALRATLGPPSKASKPPNPSKSSIRKRKRSDAVSEPKMTAPPNLNAAGKYIAIDCEMVGIEPDNTSILARVSVVNYEHATIYDTYVLPPPGAVISDYRTPISGIRPSNLRPDVARPFREVQQEIVELIKGRIVVGHALKHDFAVLMLDHPAEDVRDTSRHTKYRQLVGGAPKLSMLAELVLGLDIQAGEHDSREDARIAMMLFRADKEGFEGGKRKKKRVK